MAVVRLARSVLTLSSLVRSRDAISVLALHGEPLFFQHFDGPYYPTLRILHKCTSYLSLYLFRLLLPLACLC